MTKMILIKPMILRTRPLFVAGGRGRGGRGKGEGRRVEGGRGEVKKDGRGFGGFWLFPY